MRVIGPGQLGALLRRGDPKPLLLDVREPGEFEICRIPGSRLIPMNEIPARLNELDPNAPVVVICHHGIRSAQVAAFLSERGFMEVMNLEGGIDAWACTLDAAVPRY